MAILISSLNDWFSPAQVGFLVGFILATAMLGYMVIVYKKQYDRLAKRYAHATNDNDFIQAEAMMIVSRTNPVLIQQLKESEDFKKMKQQYNLNKQFINAHGRRP